MSDKLIGKNEIERFKARADKLRQGANDTKANLMDAVVDMISKESSLVVGQIYPANDVKAKGYKVSKQYDHPSHQCIISSLDGNEEYNAEDKGNDTFLIRSRVSKEASISKTSLKLEDLKVGDKLILKNKKPGTLPLTIDYINKDSNPTKGIPAVMFKGFGSNMVDVASKEEIENDYEIYESPKKTSGLKYDDGRDAYVNEDTGFIGENGPATNKEAIKDLVGSFWVLTYPTKLSTLDDILFSANVARMELQFRGGLKEEDIYGVYPLANAEQAKADAEMLIAGMHGETFVDTEASMEKEAGDRILAWDGDWEFEIASARKMYTEKWFEWKNETDPKKKEELHTELSDIGAHILKLITRDKGMLPSDKKAKLTYDNEGKRVKPSDEEISKRIDLVNQAIKKNTRPGGYYDTQLYKALEEHDLTLEEYQKGNKVSNLGKEAITPPQPKPPAESANPNNKYVWDDSSQTWIQVPKETPTVEVKTQ